MVLLIAGALAGRLVAQEPGRDRGRFDRSNPQMSRFVYWIHATPVAGSDSVLFRLYAKIPYDAVQFVRKDTVFSARYDMTVQVQNQRREIVFGKIVKRNISTDAFRKTNDPKLAESEMVETKLAPGPVTVFIELNDPETVRPFQKTESITLPSFFAKPLVLAEPFFFHKAASDSSRASVFPEIPPVRSMTDSLFFAKVWISTYHAPTGTIPSDSLNPPCRISWYVSKDNQPAGKAKPVEQDSMHLVLKDPVQCVDLPLNQKFEFGRYRLRVIAVAGNARAEVQRSFMVQWGQHPTLLPDFEMLVNPLSYIMNSKEYADLKKKPLEEQRKQVEEFWKQRDPTPGTTENELEEEYYRRVEYVNSNFSLFKDGKDGWQTDRGRIYLMYGNPTDIVRNPDYGSGYTTRQIEIWLYQNMQKRFIFTDATGSGDYHLISEE